MKRLATATVFLTALATVAQAGGLPKPIRLVERIKNYDITHYVRGAQGGSSHGYEAPEAEARKDVKDESTAKTAKAKKDKSQPAKAD
jgi:hypothetical protein